MSKPQKRPFNPWRFTFKSRHDPVRKLPDFEAEFFSEAWKANRVHVLRRHEEPVLAAKLNWCLEGKRCLSGACPICGRMFRRWFPIALGRLVRKLDLPTSGFIISLVPAGFEIPLKDFRSFDPQAVENHVRRNLKKTILRDEVIIGGLDLSVNEDSKGDFTPYVQPHFYVLVPSLISSAEVHRELRSLFRQTEHTKRPVNIVKLADLEAQATYALKSVFERRIKYFDVAKGKHDTRHLPLRPLQEVELLVFLDRIGMTGRLLLLNVRRRGYRFVVEEKVLAAIRNRTQRHSGTLE